MCGWWFITTYLIAWKTIAEQAGQEETDKNPMLLLLYEEKDLDALQELSRRFPSIEDIKLIYNAS